MKTSILAAIAVGAFSYGANSALAETFSYTGAIEDYTVSRTGLYDISAFGAKGGNSVQGSGGYGAEIGGTTRLAAGDVLTLLVGGSGLPGVKYGTANYGSGGGGGSFVALANAPLIIAGGGGGAGFQGHAQGGLTSTSGGAGQVSSGSVGEGFGGSNGNGGGVAAYYCYGGGGGGGGFFSGGSDPYDQADVCGVGHGGASFLSGGAGGAAGAGNTGNGGFGGGAGGGGDALAGGGGGGYSGGGGGTGNYGGGGGGSFIAKSVIGNLALAGANNGAGMISIDLIAVPEPSTWAIMLVGFGGLGATMRSRRKAAGATT